MAVLSCTFPAALNTKLLDQLLLSCLSLPAWSGAVPWHPACSGVCTQKDPCPDFSGVQVGWVKPISQGWTWVFVGTCLQQHRSEYLSDFLRAPAPRICFLGNTKKAQLGPEGSLFSGRRKKRMIMPGEFSWSLCSRPELQCLVLTQESWRCGCDLWILS